MGLLESATGAVNSVSNFIANPFSKKVKPTQNPQPDFPQGFIINEIVDGEIKAGESIRLTGSWMPFQPLPFGGKQRIKRDYYPGNSEPVIHVLGPEENNLVLKGKFTDKNLKINPDQGVKQRGASNEMAQWIDSLRIRGNLLRLTLGEYRRYGFLEETNFELNTLAEVSYTLTFSIVGFNPPLNCNVVNDSAQIPFEINKQLARAASAYLAFYSAVPSSIPQSLADVLNGVISDIMGVVSTVNNFVDTVVGQVEDLNKVLNRGIGIVKYAKTQVLRYRMRLGRITSSLYSAGLPVPERYRNAAFITGAAAGTLAISQNLTELQKRLEQLRTNSPQARHRVVQGDTLQKIAVRYYKDAGQWEKVYNHNKLTSTELENGVILEIPK